MLERAIMCDLEAWKARPHHPLILSGLRQTGKTFIVREFGTHNYPNVVYLDLRANTAVHAAFEGSFDVNQMVLSITAAVPDVRFIPGQTLLVLDEIQDCPNARSSLKYWDLDGRYDVIATGSFLGVKGFRDPYPRGIPVGYEERLTMHPLSFREFVRNAGVAQEVLEYAQGALSSNEPLLPAVHEGLRSLYLQYLVDVGLVMRAYNLREISSPLEGAKIPNEFKVFFVDTGLFASQLEHGTAARILSGNLSAYKGAMAENMVAAAFANDDRSLYYFHASSGSPELDFVANLFGEPTIVECKSNNGRATSMKYVLANAKKYGVHPAVKFADTNVGGGKGFVTLPLYALGFLPEPEEHLMVPEVRIELPSEGL